jgi:hypothetical protein
VERFLNWLAFESGILTERFQKRHLIGSYSTLALALAVYLLVGSTWIITLGAIPGLILFIVSLEALAWKKAVEMEDSISLLREFL